MFQLFCRIYSKVPKVEYTGTKGYLIRSLSV